MNRSADPELAPATISEADGVRYLHLGTPWVQGAMRLNKPAALELEYIQRMMVWMLLRPEPELTRGHAVQLGLGAAAITRFCHGMMRMRTTAVELNPSVIAACRMFFRLPHNSARLQVLQMNAGDYVAQAELSQTAQVLCVDLYDHDAASPVLDSELFYRRCRRLLDEGGVMSVNLFGRDASFERSARRIAAAFGADRVWSLQPTKEGNTIVLALRQEMRQEATAQGAAPATAATPDRATLAARAQNIETRFGLPARKWLRMIRPLPPLPLSPLPLQPSSSA
jgi:spermidine synthase